MQRRLAAMLALAALLQACASVAPDFTVPLGDQGFGDHQVDVFDPTGLVTGAKAEMLPPGDPHGEVVAHPDRMELQIGWLGGACSHRPTIQIGGTAAALRITITNPNDPQPIPFLPIACPAVGIPMGVTLTLTQPVEQDAVEVEVQWP